MLKKIMKLMDKKIFAILIIFRVVLSLHNAFISYLMKVILDEIFNKNISIINIVFIIMILTTLFHSYIYYIYYITLEKMKKILMENITFSIVKKYLKNKDNNLNIGSFTTLINEDVFYLGDYFMYGFFYILDFCIMLSIGFIYISFFSFKAFIFYLFTGLIFLYYSKKNYENIYLKNEKFYEKEDKHKQYYDSLIKNIPILQIYNILKWVINKHNILYKEKIDKYKNVASTLAKMDSVLTSGIYLVQIISFVSGIYLVYINELTIAEMISIWNIGVGSIIYVFIDLPPIVKYMASQKTSIERIEKNIFEKDINNIQNITYNKNINGIRGENICFSYEDKIIFDNFNFFFPYKKISYILGENGSGKTTLLKILLNDLEIKKGKIESNTKDLDFAFVGQKNDMFTVSIYDNLCLGKNIEEDKIKLILQKLNLYNKIDKLPNKLNTILNEETKFSGGEIRRLALARAMLTDSDFLLLDEPFSDIDKENQDLLMKYLLEIKNEKTIIIISHTTDMILVDDNILRLGE